MAPLLDFPTPGRNVPKNNYEGKFAMKCAPGFFLSVVTVCVASSWAAVAAAQNLMDLPDCVLIPGSPDSCSPIAACMPGDGVYLVGRAVGWDFGTLGGITNTGVSCVGTWDTRGFGGVGRVSFECADGLTGRVIYYSRDNATGTAHGRGMTNALSQIEGWSGDYIEEFLRADSGQLDGELMCGKVPMPLS